VAAAIATVRCETILSPDPNDEIDVVEAFGFASRRASRFISHPNGWWKFCKAQQKERKKLFKRLR
jgi:hypothetical protein